MNARAFARAVFEKLALFALAMALVGTIAVVRLHLLGYGFVLPTHGTRLGEADGVAVYASGGYDARGEYGLEHQCVELANRALVLKKGHRNLTRTGDADSYYWDAARKGLAAYPNGGTEPPRAWDLLVFDESDHDGSVGHVAVVTDVELAAGRVTFIEQNFTSCRLGGLLCRPVWKDSLAIRRDADGWRVDQGNYPFPVAGWSRSHSPSEDN